VVELEVVRVVRVPRPDHRDLLLPPSATEDARTHR
jgi:hypothetical protein